MKVNPLFVLGLASGFALCIMFNRTSNAIQLNQMQSAIAKQENQLKELVTTNKRLGERITRRDNQIVWFCKNYQETFTNKTKKK